MLTIADIKKATKGKLVQGQNSMIVSGVSIDSRTIHKRDVFIAIKGQYCNGHDFIRAAIKKGAIAIVVSQGITCSAEIAIIHVKDTTKALGQIAAWYRQQFDIPVIAVTGSVGKTTTKDLIASVLSSRFKVLKNIKTENNQYGVPLTLLRLNASIKIIVLEMGTNQTGDIAKLAQIARPTTVVLTNIGESHLAGLKSLKGIFREKMQLIKYMKPRGTIILNGDDRFFKTILNKKYKQDIISFGCGGINDFRAILITIQSNHRSTFQVRGHSFKIGSPAMHNVYNALAAISCGLQYKIRYNKISDSLAHFSFRHSRQQIIKSGKFWLIDDTYNANPASLNSAIDTLNAFSIKGKRIVVCADMLELGAQSESLHRLAGKKIAQSAADVVLTVGNNARFITESLHQFNRDIEARHCVDVREVHRRLKGLYCPGDVVLVKGSRGMCMERTVTFLKLHFK